MNGGIVSCRTGVAGAMPLVSILLASGLCAGSAGASGTGIPPTQICTPAQSTHIPTAAPLGHPAHSPRFTHLIGLEPGKFDAGYQAIRGYQRVLCATPVKRGSFVIVGTDHSEPFSTSIAEMLRRFPGFTTIEADRGLRTTVRADGVCDTAVMEPGPADCPMLRAESAGCSNGCQKENQNTQSAWWFTQINGSMLRKTNPRKDVVVAMLDRAVNVEHLSLKARIWKHPEDGANTESDLDGCNDEGASGWDLVTERAAHHVPGEDHGTEVAGVIAQMAAAAGADQVRIMPLRVGAEKGCDTAVSIARVARALYYAIDHGASVVNASMEWPASNIIDAAMREGVQHGITFVVAAGSDGDDLKLQPQYPALSGFVAPGVITVAGVGSARDPWCLSNFASGVSLLAAPASCVCTATGDQSQWRNAGGTSIAAAVVSGAIATIKSDPSLHCVHAPATLSRYLMLAASDYRPGDTCDVRGPGLGQFRESFRLLDLGFLQSPEIRQRDSRNCPLHVEQQSQSVSTGSEQ